MKLHHRLIAITTISLVATGTVYLIQRNQDGPAPTPVAQDDSSRVSLGSSTIEIGPGNPSNPRPRPIIANGPNPALRTGQDSTPDYVIIAPGELIDNESETFLIHRELSFPLDPLDTIEGHNNRPDPNDVPARKVRETDALIDHLLNPTQ